MDPGERNQRGKIQQQVTNIERTELDWKTAAEAENKRGENRPNIKLDQIQSQCRDEAEFLIIFANRSSVGNSCKNNADECPADEEECGFAPVHLEGPHGN